MKNIGIKAATAFGALVLALAVNAQQAPADTIARIKSEGVVRIGIRDSAAPFSYLDTAGKPAGFSWELCRAMVKQLEAELKTPLQVRATPVSLAESFDMLADGRIDLQCGSTTHTAERAAKVDFSYTFFVSGIAVAYRKEDVAFAHPLTYGRVAVLSGSTAARIMNKRFATKGASSIDMVVNVKSYEEGVEKLKKKEVDTFFADSTLIPLDSAIDRRRALETVEPYAFMLRKNDRAFTEAVDRCLVKVLASPATRQFASAAGLDGRINVLTSEAWRRPSKDAAPEMY